MNYMKNGDQLNSVPFYYDPEKWFNSEKQHAETLISRIKGSQNLLNNLLDINEKYSVFEDVMTDLMSTMNSSWVREQLSEEDVNALFEDVKGDVYGVSEDSTYDQKIEALEKFYSKKESEVIVKEGDPRLNAIEGVSLPMTYRSYVDQGRFDDLLRSVEEKIELLSKKLEKRFTTEYSFEEWIRMNPNPDMFALQSKKALQNEYIRLKKQLLSLQSRELRETFLKPVGTPNLDDLAKRIEDLFNESGRSATPPANLKEVTDYHLTTLPENLSKVTYSYMQSKKDVGIFALASTHTVKAQKAGVMFDMNTEYDIPVKKGKPGRTVLSGIHFDYSKFKKEQDGSGRYYDGMISMSSVMNETGEIITEIISEMVNAAVDGVNNPILHILNIPPTLAPAAVSLVRMGVPMTDTIYFMNQPIVRDFIEAKETSKGAMVKALSDLYSNFKMYDADIVSEMEGKYAVGETIEKTGPTYFTSKMLEDMIGKLPEEMTPEQRSHQLQILTDLIVYMNIGDDMTAAINAQSFDTKLPKSRAEMRLTMAMYDEILSRGVFPNVERITEDDDVYLKAMKDYNDVADDVLEELFIAEDGTLPFKEVFRKYMRGEGMNLQNDFKLGYAKLLGSLSHPNNRMARDKKVRVLERFEQFHIASLVQNVIGPIGKVSDSAERLMFGNEKGVSMAQTIEKIQTDPEHPLHNNRFMNAFLPVIQDDRNDPTKNDHIEPRFKAMNMYEDAAIVDDFEAIRAYDAQNNTSYASDLWKTAVLQAGMMNTPFSFLERLSGEMTADIMSGMYDSYRETEAQLRDPNNANLPSGYLLLRMFAENMVNDPDIVPFVSKDRNGDPSPSERMESYALFVKTYSAGTSAQIKRSVGESKTQKEYDLYMAVDSSTIYDVHGKKKKISYEPLNGKLLSSRTYLQAFAGSVKKSDRLITKKKDC